MISGFRKSLRSWATVLLLFVALMAIVITGFGTGGFGGIGSLGGSAPGATQLATVDGRPINANDVSELITRAFNQARSQNPNLDMATFLAQGSYDLTLSQMITAEAVNSFAEARGIIVSPRMIDREILAIPAFRNLAGQFDQATFRQVLARENLTEASVRKNIGQMLTRRQLLGPLAVGMRVPEGVAREYANLLLERRRGAIALVDAGALAAGINPTDAQLGQFYQRNRRAFIVPERRVIKYALIGPEQIRANVAATEAEIAANYRANAAQYGPRETRTLQSIVLPTQQAAQAFAQAVRGGTPFIHAATGAGFQAGDVTLADQRREQFASTTTPEIATAAFAAAQGTVIGPTRSELGYHVVRVDRINAIPARPLEAVRADIARTIEAAKRTEALAALVSSVEDRLGQGASFEEAARAAGLTIVTTPPVNIQGQSAGGPPWTAPPELARLLRSAFDMDPEEPEPVIEPLEANVRYALLGVDRVDPAAPPPLAEVRDRVRAAYVRTESMRRARALSDRIVARINAGASPATAFAEAGVPLQVRQIDAERREVNRAGTQPPPGLVAFFSVPRGRARVIRGPGASWLIVAPTEQIRGNAAGNPQMISELRGEFTQTAAEELAQQFARSAELRATITRDEDAIRRARGQVSGGLAPAAEE